MSADELDALLRDRFDLSRAEIISALKTLPTRDHGSASLTRDAARLLDSVGFVSAPGADAESVVEVAASIARLIRTGYSDAEVALGLGVSECAIRQRRRERTLWAIEADGSWIYPAAQFIEVRVGGSSSLSLIPHLDRVLPALPADLQPAAVAGFLLIPRDALVISGRESAVLEWLSGGGPVEPVLQLVEIGRWAAS
ncbi:hypothetical protein MRAB57_1576 [Mycobacterium rhizamassiliense]|jgi:hypothetical protein|uniref:Uncharacterized protein n=1 Tax=Mycobacterium rhizamassiliense TaxID=1841860 RepID=A0A2U3NQI6_9MYCO|nr:hypothetical protein [Mycobacterium rhizamassiliense]SPM33772.1 hypothetical protein MRAB57_1576 [Mycobacterium rhizamassiliense]